MTNSLLAVLVQRHFNALGGSIGEQKARKNYLSNDRCPLNKGNATANLFVSSRMTEDPFDPPVITLMPYILLDWARG